MKYFTFTIMVLMSLANIVYAQDKTDASETAANQQVDETQLPTGRLITPAGDSITFNGRPVDLQINSDGSLVFAKDRNSLRVFTTAKFELIQTVESPGGASLFGLAVANSGNVYFTNAKNGLHVFSPAAGAAKYKLERTIELPADCFPCGVKVSPDETTAVVCLSKKNSIAVVDLKASKVTSQIQVGVAPFDVLVDWKSQKAFVSNIGGRRPVEGDLTALSGGTETIVDQRGIAASGTVSQVDIIKGKSATIFAAGLHPSVMSWGETKNEIAICNTNSDTVSRLGIKPKWSSEISVRPDRNLSFGSMPSAIQFLKDKSTGAQQMLVALAGNNAISVIDPTNSKRLELIPTGWYPAALAANDDYVFVANIKGVGSRSNVRDEALGRNSHDHAGSVQRIKRSILVDQDALDSLSETVSKNGRFPQILRAIADSRRGDKTTPSPKPIPIPRQLGDPSVFKHVIYVIKENRTYDQVFGDFENSRGEPKLCVFPRKITPNHHALAERFGILDNYYCNGVLSADGHSWATEGNVMPYLERAFGGFARSYTFGDDPITYSSSGFIWDHVLSAGLSFRNYGEMNYSTPPKGMKYQEVWKAYSEGKPIKFEQKIGIKRLRDYSCREYPGWNMVIPDVLRMDRFLKEFREFEDNDALPSLCLVYLPQDHLGGGVTSEAHMADNDLALGRLVQAVSKSKYWKDTVIFVNEDDPQNGYDHVDGHRSICLPISAYSKPGVNHNFYNQTSVLRTILHIFGLPPMNQQDASMPLMTECFQDEPNLEPFVVLDANIPLNQTAKPKKQQTSTERQWRGILATVPIERTGMKSEKDEDNLNRFVWHEVRGWEVPYPVLWSGAHGKGLKKLGLIFDPDKKDD